MDEKESSNMIFTVAPCMLLQLFL